MPRWRGSSPRSCSTTRSTRGRGRSHATGRALAASRLIARELRANGVEAAIADEAAAAVSDEDAAYRLAARRLRSLAGLEYDAFRNRLGAYLQRRGFGWDVCRATVDRCWRGATTDDREQTTGGE